MPNEILIYDPIGPAWAGMIDDKMFMEELNSFGGQDVTIRVNSPGGDVFMANAMYNAIDRYTGRVTVSIDALAASALSYLILAADEVVAAKNAMIMVHKPETLAWGNATSLRKTADVLDKAESTLLGMYTDKTGKTSEEVAAVLEAETWFTAQEALDWGLVDRIGKVSDVTARVPDGMFNKTPVNLLIKPKTLSAKRRDVDLAKANAARLMAKIS